MLIVYVCVITHKRERIREVCVCVCVQVGKGGGEKKERGAGRDCHCYVSLDKIFPYSLFDSTFFSVFNC